MSRSSACSIKKMNVNVKSFNNTIPSTIRNEIQQVVKNTQKTGIEESLTFCRLKGKDKIFVSDYSTGNKNETYVMPCNSAHGNTEKIGDFHSHPTQDPGTVGITPSVADFVSTLEESVDIQIPQISCISSSDARGIHCYQPKPAVIKDTEKIKNYKKAARYYSPSDILDIPPYVREHVADDFDHAWFNRKTWEREKNPKAKDIVHDAFINSKKALKFEDVDELGKGPFCEIIQDLNNPKDDNVGMECRRVLKVRDLFGIRY